MTIENRTRVPSGVRSGGQFAAEVHAEAAGVTLTAQPTSAGTDAAVMTAVGDLARTNANFQLAEWERRLRAQNLPWHSASDPAEVAPERVKAVQQAKEFESLSRVDQEQLLDAVKLSGVKHLLEPGQKLGTDRIHVAEGLNLEDANLAMVLTAQAEVHKANLPSTVTLTGIGDVAAFSIQDGDIRHELRIGPGMIAMSAEPEEDDPYTRGTWLYRADQTVFGGSILEQDRSSDLAGHYETHRKYAAVMDVMASSPLKNASDEIGELDLKQRTAELRADDAEYILDISGDAPVLRGGDGKNLHPSMTAGYLDHIARLGDLPDGKAVVAGLRDVFAETDRRLAS